MHDVKSPIGKGKAHGGAFGGVDLKLIFIFPISVHYHHHCSFYSSNDDRAHIFVRSHPFSSHKESIVVPSLSSGFLLFYC